MTRREHFGLRGATLGAALLALPACSAVVSDLGNITPDLEGCVQHPEYRDRPRPLTLVLSEMEPHGSQKTVVSMVRRRSSMLQAKVVLMPTGAAALGPRRLVLDPRVDTNPDGMRCVLARGTRLDALVRVPNAVPPDASNEGPYAIEFWSDLNRNGTSMPDPFPADHSWAANVCDDGTFVFPHNTGFEALDPPPQAGTFRLHTNPSEFTPLLALVSTRIDDALPLPSSQQALFDQTVERLNQLPFVVSVVRQGTTVGALVTELECLVPEVGGDNPGRVTLAIPGVVDGGNFHDVEVYFDTQRNGRLDPMCDPKCTFMLQQTAVDGSLALDLDAITGCVFPDGFHQDSPGEDCAIIEAPSVSEFLAATPRPGNP